MESNYIQLNFPNFVTVLIMASVGIFVIGFLTRGVKTVLGSNVE